MEKFLFRLLLVICVVVSVRLNLIQRSEINSLSFDLASAKAHEAALEQAEKTMAEKVARYAALYDESQAATLAAQANTQLIIDMMPRTRVAAWQAGWFVGTEDILKLMLKQKRTGISTVNDLKARQLDVLCATNALPTLSE